MQDQYLCGRFKTNTNSMRNIYIYTYIRFRYSRDTKFSVVAIIIRLAYLWTNSNRNSKNLFTITRYVFYLDKIPKLLYGMLVHLEYLILRNVMLKTYVRESDIYLYVVRRCVYDNKNFIRLLVYALCDLLIASKRLYKRKLSTLFEKKHEMLPSKKFTKKKDEGIWIIVL